MKRNTESRLIAASVQNTAAVSQGGAPDIFNIFILLCGFRTKYFVMCVCVCISLLASNAPANRLTTMKIRHQSQCVVRLCVLRVVFGLFLPRRGVYPRGGGVYPRGSVLPRGGVLPRFGVFLSVRLVDVMDGWRQRSRACVPQGHIIGRWFCFYCCVVVKHILCVVFFLFRFFIDLLLRC